MILEKDRRLNRLGIAVLLIIAFALRMHNLGHQELRGDEAFSWNYVVDESNIISILERIINEGDPQPPLHYWLLQLWVNIFGDTEISLRIPSVLLSLIVIVLVYQIGCRTVSYFTGSCAAFLTSIHPFQVWLAQDVRNMYQLAILFVLCATLVLPGLMKGKWQNWWLYIGCGSLAMYSHYYAIFGLVAHGFYVIVMAGTYWYRWVIAMGSIGLLLLPWAVIILPVFLSGQLADPGYIDFYYFVGLMLRDFSLGTVVSSSISQWTAIFMTVVFFIGALMLLKDKDRDRSFILFLVMWPVVAIVGIYLVVLHRNTLNTFYFLMAFPAVYVIVCGAWEYIRDIDKFRRMADLVVTLYFMLIVFGLWNYYFVDEWSKNRGLREIASIMKADVKSRDVFISNFPDPTQDYYLRTIIDDRIMLPANLDMTYSDVLSELNMFENDYDRLWFIPMISPNWDADSLALNAIENKYLSDYQYVSKKLALMRFVVQPSEAVGVTFVGKTFIEGPKIEYVHLTVNGIPDIYDVNIGDELIVTLVWSTKIPINDSYVVFVHLLDTKGHLLASHDGIPGDGLKPTNYWDINERILDRHRFDIPVFNRDQSVVLVAGLYQEQTAERLLLYDDADHVPLTELQLISDN